MKTRKTTLKSIAVFALALIVLTSAVLPLSAAGSSLDDNVVGTYTVKSGDTLSKIASAYGVTVSSIVNTNAISASADLYAGQRLKIPGATSVEEDTSTVYGSSSLISFDFKEADLLGALETILAHTGYTMIFKGSTTTVTLAMNNVTPLTAIDYVLRMVDMTYIKNDGIIYVSTADVLNNNFADSAALTKFSTKYISQAELMTQLGTIGITVSVVKTEINNRAFWVSGTPMQLAKVRDMIKLLDNKSNITTGTEGIASNLTPIEMTYLTAAEFSSLLGQLGLHTGITMEAHPKTLYVYATGDVYKDIIKIKNLVDTKDASMANVDENGDVIISDGETSLVKLELKYLTKEDAETIVTTFGYEVEVLGLDFYEKTVWIRGTADIVQQAVKEIKANDIESNNSEREHFTYELKNTVASEIQKRIAYVELTDVEFYFGSYPQLTKSFVVYCPSNKVEHVKEVLDSLDNNLGKMYYPLETITSSDEFASIIAKEELVVKFINVDSISTDVFAISGDLDGSEEGEKYILYIYDSPENIDLIMNMWGQIG